MNALKSRLAGFASETGLICAGLLAAYITAGVSHLSVIRLLVAGGVAGGVTYLAGRAARIQACKNPQRVTVVCALLAFIAVEGTQLVSLSLVVALAGAFAAVAVRRHPDGVCARLLGLRDKGKAPATS